MYNPLAAAFDKIFPVDSETVAFALRQFPNGPILDLACGSGGYAVELAKRGMQVVGIDLADEMILASRLRAKREGVDVDFRVGDMASDLGENRYAGVLFIGNSLVHAKDRFTIRWILSSVRKALRNEGTLVLQILNYDRIQDEHIRSLPLIEQDGIRFERRYEEMGDVLSFVTTLDAGPLHVQNAVPLIPLSSDELLHILKETGWTEIALHDDFTDEPFDPAETFALVVTAKKGAL